MIKGKKLSKIISGIVAGGMLLSFGITALASESSSTAGNAAQAQRQMRGEVSLGKIKGHGGKDFKGILPGLVKDGTITQAEADKITAYMDQKREQIKSEIEKTKGMTEQERRAYIENFKKQNGDIFTEMVSKKIISQSKADAIKNKMAQMAEAERAARLNKINDELNSLVQKGTITKDQAGKVMANIKLQEEQRKANFEKAKNMTPEQRKTFMEGLKGQRKDMLKEMVDNKSLTQAQADAIRQILRQSHKSKAGEKTNSNSVN